MPGILWLASYPKSGNTWLRAFLANYIHNPDAPLPIDDLQKFNFSDGIAAHFEKVATRSVVTMTFSEIQALRPKVHEMFARSNPDPVFVKTHNAVSIQHGIPMISPQFTAGAVYVIRNPLDVVVSYAHHYGETHDQAITAMAADDRIMLPHLNQIYQHFGSWSHNVKSWTTAPGLNCHVMRYEDMTLKPQKTWRALIKYLGMPLENTRLKKSMKFSSFKELAKQEKDGGFVEAVEVDNRIFFRKGKTGSWRQDLSADQIQQVIDSHGDVMAEYGYLTKKGEPRF